jgi:membrane protein
MQRIKDWISKTIEFLKSGIWKTHTGEHSRINAFLIKYLKIFLLALREFEEERGHLRASALTFYSLLSVVPVLALAFAIAKGFGFEMLLEQKLIENLPKQEAILQQVIRFIDSLLASTKGGVLAGIGIIALFWAVVKLLGNIEQSFNDIWKIKKARSFGRKFSDYLSLMLLAPVLFILASSATVFIATQVKEITEQIALVGYVSPVIFFFLRLLPYVLIWVLLSFIYIFMPNTRVQWRSGILAGVIAGTLYQVIQLIYIQFQIGVTKYNAIYGSFAALPLFFIWMQLSWLIVLLGALIAFAHQNIESYEYDQEYLQVSPGFKRLLSLQVANFVIKKFIRGEDPPTADQISRTLKIPIRLMNQLLDELTEGGIFSETITKKNEEIGFQPARDTGTMTIGYVIDALEQRGSDELRIPQTDELKVISTSLQTFRNQIKKSPANRLLEEI